MHVSKVDCRSSDAPREFTHSLRETGFAILQNHSIDPLLLNDVYEGWKAFFADDAKQEFLFDPEKQDGFFPYRSENAKGSEFKDLKEFYHFYPWGKCPAPLQKKNRQSLQPAS